jgi:microcystin-dependent protein
MSTPFLGQIQPFPYNFAPKGWALCNGQLLPISQSSALFSLLGTTYGGNGINNFALPNLQGLCALSMGIAPSGTSYTLGQKAGEANHVLLATELPLHTHLPACSTVTGNRPTPVGSFPATSASSIYFSPSPSAATTLGPGSSLTGGSQPHANQSPYLVLNFCIALAGIFPSRN